MESFSNAGRRGWSEPKRRFSLAGRLTVLVAFNVVVTVLITAALSRLALPIAVSVTIALLVALPLSAITTRAFGERVTRRLGALVDGVRGFRDEDFSLRLAVQGDDEISDLLRVYNEMGDVLRSQRGDTVQKELLLDTILQGTPTAIVLTNPADRIVFANHAARQIVGRGERIEGHRFAELVARMPDVLREAIAAERDALFTVPSGDREETFHLTHRTFHLNTQRHTLVMLERLTPELRRQEVAVWKKAIRTMSHELNNSLAPISSLVHTVRHVGDRPEHAHHLDEMYETIDERLRHLRDFLQGYAEFARLPAPRRERVSWREVLDEVRNLYAFTVTGSPDATGNFDRAQMQQVLINLLKNAHESGSAAADVIVEVTPAGNGTQVRVMDRGRGMDEATRRQAILPFYSTKASGTGLGLAICNEIIDAHGGRLSLHAREGGGVVVAVWVGSA